MFNFYKILKYLSYILFVGMANSGTGDFMKICDFMGFKSTFFAQIFSRTHIALLKEESCIEFMHTHLIHVVKTKLGKNWKHFHNKSYES